MHPVEAAQASSWRNPEEAFARALRRPKSPKKELKGHESLLRGLEASGAQVALHFMDSDDLMYGKVKHSDAYTISIQPDMTDSTIVYFKHALRGFEIITPSPRKVAEAAAATQE